MDDYGLASMSTDFFDGAETDLCTSIYNIGTPHRLLAQFLPALERRKLHNTLMHTLPLMPVVRKSLKLRFRDLRKHTHFQNIQVREKRRLALDRPTIRTRQ